MKDKKHVQVLCFALVEGRGAWGQGVGHDVQKCFGKMDCTCSVSWKKTNNKCATNTDCLHHMQQQKWDKVDCLHHMHRAYQSGGKHGIVRGETGKRQ